VFFPNVSTIECELAELGEGAAADVTLADIKVLFVRAFTRAYEPLLRGGASLAPLGIDNATHASLAAYLDTTFEEKTAEAAPDGHTNHRVCAITNEGRLAGYVSFLLLDDGESILVRALSVDPAYERHGIGGRLVAHAGATYPSARRILGVTRVKNAMSHGFLAKHGFTPSAYLPHPRMAVHFQGYERSLTPAPSR
jgi:GNAT superfamily N-acetyltransferase